MAFLTSRLVNRNLRSTLCLLNRTYASKDTMSAAPQDLATGIEKAEMMAIQAGHEDPFKVKAIKRKASSKNDPNLISSYYDSRIIGCICEEESTSVKWMWLHLGEPKRCECGHWFKLVEYKPPF